jgi:hypothetical protein
MSREDKLTEVWKALEIIGAADADVLGEALAGLEADDPDAYAQIANQFANKLGWRG